MPAEQLWGKAAGELGHFDQAHLIRDLRAAIGLTPTADVAACRDGMVAVSS